MFNNKRKNKKKLYATVQEYLDKLLLIDLESDDTQDDLNEKLNELGLEIENLTGKLGNKLMMDFGIITWVFSTNHDEVLSLIKKQYNITNKDLQ